MQHSTHENFSRDETVGGSSERAFGTVMGVAFAAVSLLNWWHNGHSWRWTIGVAVFFVLATLIYPIALKPLNRLWFKFGLLLQKVANPVAMAFVFFGAALPTGIIMRALGNDPLRLKWQSDVNSYWIERRPPGPTPETMKDQF
jgi:Saxitoxin biosynthesis operon protein SxtJ